MKILICLLLVATLNPPSAENPPDNLLPVRAFCIPVPSENHAEEFIRFIEKELAPMDELGVAQTSWSGSGGYLDHCYGRKPANDQKSPGHSESKCFLRMFAEIAARQ